MDELPAGAPGLSLSDAASRALASAIAGDAVANPVEAAELLDVDVDQFARMFPLVAAHRLGRLQRLDAIEAEPLQNAADGGRRDPDRDGDLLAGPALAPPRFDRLDNGRRRRPVQAMRPRGTILEALQAFRPEPRNPLAHRPRADACGSCSGLRRQPARDLVHDALSTKRCQAGILVDVHPVPPRTLTLRNISFPGPNRMDNLLKAH